MARRIAMDRLAILIALPALAFALYMALGHPAAIGDEPATQSVEASAPALARHLRSHPDDARAWVLLARALAADEHFDEAAEAYRRAVTFPTVARDASVWAEYADALGMTQAGSLAGKPTELIEQALARDPRQRQALELAGSAAYERRDFAAAIRYWTTLLAQLPSDSPEARSLSLAIERSQRMARVSLPVSG